MITEYIERNQMYYKINKISNICILEFIYEM